MGDRPVELDVQVQPAVVGERVVLRRLDGFTDDPQLTFCSPQRAQAGAGALDGAASLDQLGDRDRLEVDQQVHGLAQAALHRAGVEAVHERASLPPRHDRDQTELRQ